MDINTGVQAKREVFQALHDHSAQIKKLGLKSIGLFGSFVRDEQTPESDIDLLIQFEPNRKSFDNSMELSTLLENLLHRRVELVTTEALSPYIGPHIMSEVEYVSLSASKHRLNEIKDRGRIRFADRSASREFNRGVSGDELRHTLDVE